MNSKPILSVLVTFCNQKKYVKDCIDSILSQKTSFRYEVLIAVDGEDDGTLELLNSYHRNNLKIYKVDSDKNLLPVSRASTNRLFLLAKAQGKYFLTLDGDDFLASTDRFERGISFLEQNKNYIGHICHWCKFDDASKTFQDQEPFKAHFFSFSTYLDSRVYIHISCGIFVNIFKNKKYPYKHFFDDPCLMFYMLQYGHIAYDNAVGFVYRIGIPSIYNSQSENNKKILQLTTYMTLLRIAKCDKEVLRRALYWYKACIKECIHVSDHIKNGIYYQNILLPKAILQYHSTSNHKKFTKIFYKCKINILFVLYKNIFWKY